MAKKGYDWKITLQKAGIIALEVLLAGVAVYLTDNQICLAIVPIIEAVRNAIKHWND
jgi:hypothetical protein